MVSYRYLGYGTTDSNGIAKLDHDANGNAITHSYTGAGAGRINIVASLDNPITSNSVVSEAHEFWDCIKYDMATTSNNNSIWANNIAYLVRGDSYSTITNSESAVLIYTTISGDICIEFDVYVNDLATSSFVSVRYGSTGILTGTCSALGLETNAWHHLKIEIDDNYAVISNSENNSTVSATLENYNRLYLRANTAKSVSFRNFMIYSI